MGVVRREDERGSRAVGKQELMGLSRRHPSDLALLGWLILCTHLAGPELAGV